MVSVALMYFVFGAISMGSAFLIVSNIIFASFTRGILRWVIRHLKLARFKGTPIEETIENLELVCHRLGVIAKKRRK